jgi:hypothetical protein
VVAGGQLLSIKTECQPNWGSRAKPIAHPTDARLMHRALEKLVALAQAEGVVLHQSYRRVGKRAAIMIGRYTHAHQFKRMRRALKFLRIRLGRVIRDIRGKIAGDVRLQMHFNPLLDLAVKVSVQGSPPARPEGLFAPRARVEVSPRAKRVRPTSSAAGSRSQRPSRHPYQGRAIKAEHRRTAITSSVARATASMRSSPPPATPATTSPCCCVGSPSFCVP